MKKINYWDIEYILFCGDIHGDYDIIPKFLKKYDITNSIIFQVGDFGIGWDNEPKEIRKLMNLNQRLFNLNSNLLVIRGNHDDPKYFNNKYHYSNLKLLKDYTCISINGFNYLGIGGAVSIDRVNRKPYKTGKGVGWWKDEIVEYNNEIISDLENIDVVFSHTAPDFVSPFNKSNLNYWILRDDKILDDINHERSIMTKIYDEIIMNNNVSHWYYGHFHFSNKEKFKNTKFQLLNVNEIIEHKM